MRGAIPDAAMRPVEIVPLASMRDARMLVYSDCYGLGFDWKASGGSR